MKIVLLKDWLGHPAGSVIFVSKSMASRLKSSKVATIYDTPKMGVVENKEEENEKGLEPDTTSTGQDEILCQPIQDTAQ